MDQLVDKKAEIERLRKELAKAEKELEFSMKKLNNPGFTGKAPQQVVENVRNTAQKMKENIEVINATIESLK